MKSKERLAAVLALEDVAALLALEPALRSIFETAAATPPDSRWRMYSILKRLASRYVGWEAANPALATHQAYDTFIAALDMTLPPDTADERAETDDEQPEEVEVEA